MVNFFISDHLNTTNSIKFNSLHLLVTACYIIFSFYMVLTFVLKDNGDSHDYITRRNKPDRNQHATIIGCKVLSMPVFYIGILGKSGGGGGTHIWK